MPLAASHGSGSIFCEPFSHTSKCRCGPVELPRLPMVAISSPAATRWPCCTRISLTCPYTVMVPSSCCTRTHRPKPLAGPASTTVPSATDSTGVPMTLARSIP